ncbi:MAG TPA: hypothetical protein VKA68_07210, partial [bacterium]|nr:hypothetical protein [bacterium]
MDVSCDSPRNPLVRDGTSQTQRLLQALEPSYVNIDDRSVLDLLAYAKKIARNVQYYNRENEPEGDWLPFIENDVSIIIAEIARKDLEPGQHCMDNLFAKLETLHSADSKQARAVLARIFDILHLLAAEMNAWFGNAVEGFRLYEELDRFISGELREELRHSLRYYKHAVHENLLADMPEIDRFCDPLTFPDESLTQTSFDPRWIPADFPGPRSWSRYLDSLEPDNSIFTGSNTVERITAASDRLHRSYRMFRDAQRRVIHSAPDYLKDILEEWPRHDPHMGLFLAFLQLFRNARDHLNGLTRRHLDFYYKRVLRLDRRGPVPDTVHVIFSLAKQVNEHFLEEGTELSAGNDAAGKDVIYQLEQELEINKATVDQLKAIFIEKRRNADEEKHIIHAAPVANSSDGKGGKFTAAEPKWQTFGSADPSTTVLPDVGFALASPVLLLQEGDREITISISCGSSTADLELKPAHFQAYTSGQKKWNKVGVTSVETTGVSIKFTVSLGPEAPPVVGYNAEELKGAFATDYKVPKGDFGTNSPVIMVLLRTQSEKTADAYSRLKDLRVQRINVAVNVGGISDESMGQSGESKMGVQSLILQNDQG